MFCTSRVRSHRGRTIYDTRGSQGHRVRVHGCATTCQVRPYLRKCRTVVVRKDVFVMIDHARSTRSKGETRLDVHNSNVNEDLAEAGLCGTLNLVMGGACQLPALHEGGCDFHRITTPDAPRDEEAVPGP
jgi:hypothetical protein